MNAATIVRLGEQLARPLNWLVAGLALVLAALLWSWLLPESWFAFRLLLIALGVLSGGIAVAILPRSPWLLLGGAVTAFVAGSAMEPDWDSGIMVARVLGMVALIAAFLIALPAMTAQLYAFWFRQLGKPVSEEVTSSGRRAGRVAAKAVFSILLLLHFGGILSAILTATSTRQAPSWLASKAWMFYRPYLEFMYLTNAYKFYSPQPGPASLLWFRIEYEDGSSRWLKIPNREEHSPDPLAQEYQRRLSLAENTGQLVSTPSLPQNIRLDRLAVQKEFGNPPHSYLQVRNGVEVIRESNHLGIPLHPYLPITSQYVVPNDYSRRMLKQYAQHVAKKYPSEHDPSSPVTGVKVYRLYHDMLEPVQMANPDQSPDDIWTLWPYYQGEFTKDGVLKDPNDPMLYWLVPIVRTPPGQAVPVLRNLDANFSEPILAKDYDLHNFLEIHAAVPTDAGRKKP